MSSAKLHIVIFIVQCFIWHQDTLPNFILDLFLDFTVQYGHGCLACAKLRTKEEEGGGIKVRLK